MTGLRISIETRGLDRVAAALHGAGKKIEPGVAAAINQVGKAGKAAMVRTLPKQTGLKRKTIVRFLQQTRLAAPGSLVFSVKGRGGNVSLKYFDAKEGGGGVTAKPWNRPTFVQGAFIKSGPMGARHAVSKLNGQVYRNVAGGRWGGKIEKLNSGLYLPKEMVTGGTGEAWEQAVASALPAAVDAAVSKALSP